MRLRRHSLIDRNNQKGVEMNTKAKALVASAIVIALALATVSGVTYSWFSDSEESTINITTGKVDIELENITVKKYTDGVEGEFLSGTETHEVKNGSIIMKLDNICPGDKVVLSFYIKDNSTITCKYRYSLLADDYNGLFKGLNISAVYDSVTLTQAGYTDWKDYVSGTGTISVELPTSAGNEYQAKNVVLNFGIEAYQSNADIVTSGNALSIKTLDDLKFFAYSVNNGNDYSGETVSLVADIDMKNEPWTPIGPNADASNKFKGTFDGQNHTISNLKIDTASEHKYQATGFFGALNGKVMNLKFDNANVSGFSEAGSSGSTTNGIAVVAGSIYNSGTISNVEVKNAIVSGNRYVGTISGYVYGNIENCQVSGITLTATPNLYNGEYDNGDKVGGIVGYLANETTNTITDCSISNATISGFRNIGGITGYDNGGNKVTGCTIGDNVKVIQKSTNAYIRIIDDSVIGDIAGNGVNEPGNEGEATIKMSFKFTIVMQDGLKYCDGDRSFIEIGDAKGLAFIMNNFDAFNNKLVSDKGVQSTDVTYLYRWQIKLTDDLDFNKVQMESLPFRYGSLDGQNHTIRNANIVDNTVEDKKCVGLFKTIGKVSNLTIDHITVSSSVNNAMIGTVAGYTASEWNNVHVKDFKVESTGSGAYIGGLLGDSYGSKTNCSASEGKIIGGKNVGGFTGFIGAEKYTITLEKCTVNHVEIDANERTTTIGSFAGRINNINSTITLTDCTVNSVTGANVPSDKIYGDVPNGSIIIDGESKS